MKEESPMSDCCFEAMMDQCKVTDPQLLCRSYHKIIKVCVNPKCQISLVCIE